jgi:NAD(P)-dependent dehydrogenase (short-subunit alcohol dehydrogenase family)
MRIEGVVAITGGAGHIGHAITERCAEAGTAVAVIDREAERAEAVAARIAERGKADAAGFGVDLSDPEVIENFPARIEQRFGRLDGLVHNAAFYDSAAGWGVPFEQEGYDAWLKVMRVNLLAPFFLTQALHPMLRRSGTASIVLISSIYGIVGPDNRVYQGTEMVCPAAYAASKGGIVQLGRWLSTTLAPDVRVNTVAPGGLAREQPESFVRAYTARTPLHRLASEDDVAGAVAFLLSSDSEYITGQTLMVDGGLTAW